MMFNKEHGKVLHLEEEHFPGELKEIEHDSTLSANKVICILDCIRQHIVKGCDPLPPLSTDEITQGILRIVPVPLECKGHGHTWESPAKDHEDEQGTGLHLLFGNSVRVGTFLPREAFGGYHWCL